MSRAVRAMVGGIGMVVRAPILLVAVSITMLAAALPFGLVLNSRLQASLANQPPIALGSGEVDADWWMEFRAHAQGLEATFTPTVIGVAAPLDNLSALLDGTARPLALAGPVALAGLVWAFLWGGILHRFSLGRAQGPRGFLEAGWRHLPHFAGISLVAAVATLILYLTVHALLFGPVYGWLAGVLPSERDAFAGRLVLYLVFGAVVAAVGLVADFARVMLASGEATSFGEALAAGAEFVRGNMVAAAALYILVGLMFVAGLAGYVALEVYGGTRVGGWRAVAIGQAYIMARLALRLTLAASQVRLFSAVTTLPTR